MDLAGYLEAACRRLVVTEGFLPLEEPDAGMGIGWRMLVRAEGVPGQAGPLLLALVPGEGLAPTGDGHVRALLTGVGERLARRFGAPATVVAVFVFAGGLTAPRLDRILAAGPARPSPDVTVLSWVVDLETRRIVHQGGLAGLRPVLRVLANPEPDSFHPVTGPPVPDALPVPEAPLSAPKGPSRRLPVPYVTYGLLGAIAAAYLWLEIQGGSTDSRVLVRWGANYGPAIVLGGQYWRLVTAMFLHAGLAHLFMNSLVLVHMGRLVEAMFGSWRFTFIYFVAGISGSVLSLLFGSFTRPSVGASGALFGLFGAMVYFRIADPRSRRIPWGQLLWPIALNLAIGLIVPNIDNWAHVGGLAGGFMAGAVAGVPVRAHERWRGPLVALVAVTAGLLVAGALPLGNRARGALEQGRAALAARQYEDAEYWLQEAVREAPGDWRPHLELARLYFFTGRSAQARAEARKVVTLRPGEREAWIILQATEREESQPIP